MINPEVFREYDIRGVAERDLADPVVETLGMAFGEYLQPKSATRVTLGYDMRLSSLRIRDAFIRGITTYGIEVTDIGLCPTPALYFSLFHIKPDAGVMITASHNPPEFNGFKFCVGTDTLYGGDIQKIRRISEKIAAARRSSLKTSPGAILHHPIMPDYISYLQRAFLVCQEIPLTVVLDAGNATAGLAAPEVIRAMGCKVIELYSEPDGTFPNHHPDPTVPQNLTALIKTVIENRADMGIAFDGDSDRIGVVDERGRMIWGDQLMILFSRDILRERPGATFISEVKCSQTMYDDIRAHGGNAIMWKTGHSLIKAKMKETGAVMAAEMSGHLFFADRYFG
jgi:phosphomannomutase / phosphoglucomutase